MQQKEYPYRECFILSHIMDLPACRDWLQWVVLNPDFDLIEYHIVGGIFQAQVMARLATTEEFYNEHPEFFQYSHE